MTAQEIEQAECIIVAADKMLKWRALMENQ